MAFDKVCVDEVGAFLPGCFPQCVCEPGCWTGLYG